MDDGHPPPTTTGVGWHRSDGTVMSIKGCCFLPSVLSERIVLYIDNPRDEVLFPRIGWSQPPPPLLMVQCSTSPGLGIEAEIRLALLAPSLADALWASTASLEGQSVGAVVDASGTGDVGAVPSYCKSSPSFVRKYALAVGAKPNRPKARMVGTNVAGKLNAFAD